MKLPWSVLAHLPDMKLNMVGHRCREKIGITVCGGLAFFDLSDGSGPLSIIHVQSFFAYLQVNVDVVDSCLHCVSMTL